MARCTHVYNHNHEVFLPFKYTNQTKTGALKDKSRHWTVLFVWHLEIRAWAAVRDGWNDKPTPCGRLGCVFPPSPPKSLTTESSNHPYTNLSRVRLKGSHTNTHAPCQHLSSQSCSWEGSAAQAVFISCHRLIHKTITSSMKQSSCISWNRWDSCRTLSTGDM